MGEPPKPRHFSNNGPMLRLPRSPRDQIISNLQTLVTKYPPRINTFPSDEVNGLFSGPTSIAYILLKLSQDGDNGYNQLDIEGHKLHYWADLYLQCARDSMPENHLCDGKLNRRVRLELEKFARYGIWSEKSSQLAIIAAFHKDRTAVEDLLALLPKVLEGGGGDEETPFNEHIFGRTGYLYLLRLVRTYWPEAPIPAETFTKIIQRVLDDGKSRWKFVDHYYLGAGHGWISIITQILLTDRTYSQVCKPMLEQILNEQIRDETSSDYGNWDAMLSDQKADQERLQIQWGHGAPGVVISLQSLLPIYQNYDPAFAKRMEEAIDRAQEVIWLKGLLRKESCLCHGAAGNMLALQDRQKKEHFLAWSVEDVVQRGLQSQETEPSSYPSSLQRGLAGRIWAFYVFEKGGVGGIPGYNDL